MSISRSEILRKKKKKKKGENLPKAMSISWSEILRKRRKRERSRKKEILREKKNKFWIVPQISEFGTKKRPGTRDHFFWDYDPLISFHFSYLFLMFFFVAGKAFDILFWISCQDEHRPQNSKQTFHLWAKSFWANITKYSAPTPFSVIFIGPFQTFNFQIWKNLIPNGANIH